jgi:hypothetical protein
MKASITHARLRELLDYDPETGRFVWRVTGKGKGKRKGAIAGYVAKRGYRLISVDGRIYYAGPLAFFWVNGFWRKGEMDHANRVRDDDRLTNLRLATHSQNMANGGTQTKQRSLPKGVWWDKQTSRFRAAITVNYQHVHLGRFDRAEDAHAAYVAAAQKYFGEFARNR